MTTNAAQAQPEIEAETTKTIDDLPAAGQCIQHKGRTFMTVKEGLAHILVPEGARTSVNNPKAQNNEPGDAQSVFYNPIQQFNRDLSVLAIRAYGEDLMAVRQMKGKPRGKKRKRKACDDAAGRPPPQAIQNSSQAHENGVESNGQERLNAAGEPLMEGVERTPTGPKGPGIEEVLPDVGPADPEDAAEDAAEGSFPVAQNGEGKPQASRKQHPGRFKILDALSATGLRALRYAQEIPFVTGVTANDLSKDATDSIQANVTYNKLDDRIDISTSNAMSHMYSLISNPGERSNGRKYDVIDLDPYGTAAPFFDGAVQAINDGGLLCVTCTDAAVWASCGYPEKTYALYGGTPMKGLHSHEGGLRLILHAIASSAARYGLSIEPLLSLSIDFYARVFVRVYESPAEVKMHSAKTMVVYNCDHGCGAWTTQPLVRIQKVSEKKGNVVYKHSLSQGPTASTFCEHCGYKTHVSGPMYGGPLHNAAFIQSILTQLPTLDKATYQTVDRLEGMLTTALEETLIGVAANEEPAEEQPQQQPSRPVPRMDPLMIDRHPFSFIPSALSKVVHTRAPSEAELRGALKHGGYSVTRSHARPGTIKTNAPWTFVWHLMREWVRQKAPIKADAIKPGTAGWGIMQGARGELLSSLASDRASGSNPDPGDPSAEPHANDQPPNPGDEIKLPEVNFDEALGKEPNKRRLKRYQENPRANWGPMNRAKGPSKR